MTRMRQQTSASKAACTPWGIHSQPVRVGRSGEGTDSPIHPLSSLLLPAGVGVVSGRLLDVKAGGMLGLVSVNVCARVCECMGMECRGECALWVCVHWCSVSSVS